MKGWSVVEGLFDEYDIRHRVLTEDPFCLYFYYKRGRIFFFSEQDCLFSREVTVIPPRLVNRMVERTCSRTFVSRVVKTKDDVVKRFRRHEFRNLSNVDIFVSHRKWNRISFYYVSIFVRSLSSFLIFT